MRLWPWGESVTKHKTAIFRQINRNIPMTHHDALEFPDGQIVLLMAARQRLGQAIVYDVPHLCIALAEPPEPCAAS